MNYAAHTHHRWLCMCLVLLGLCMLPVIAMAQTTSEQPKANSKDWDTNTFTYDLQTGLDYWDLRPSVDKDTPQNLDGNTNLFLANSRPYWTYEQTAPWIRFQGTYQIQPSTQFNIKYRRDQSSGSRLDGFSVDQSYYDLGARIGVLDYKTSWCRTYDVDSPWVRENDPFCTVRSTSDPIRASPGMQVYANSVFGDFKLQGLLGIYRPMLLDYQRDEFTNNALTPWSEVVRNDRWGMSFNALNLTNGLDLRVGYLYTDQDANYRANLDSTTSRVNQRVQVVYTGVSFNVSPRSVLRLTHLNADLDSKNFYPTGYLRQDDQYPDLVNTGTIKRVSDVIEWNLQWSAQDVVSFAHSLYVFETSITSYRYRFPSGQIVTSEAPNAYFNRVTNTSLSWRRDWRKGIFTVLQWTVAQLQSTTQNNVNAPINSASSYGHALGFRFGYSF